MVLILNNYKAPGYLVTGAAGFLGSQMAWYLLDRCKRVRITDIKKPWWLGKKYLFELEKGILEFQPADLMNKEELRLAVKGVRKCFHFGALFNHSAKYDQLMKINEGGTINLCELAVEQDLERIIHMGSMSVYGHQQVASAGEKYAITERKKPHPQDPYALSKHYSRKVAASFNRENGLEVFIVDPAGVFGPYSRYGNAEIIKMLLSGLMLLPDRGKHRASMVHSKDVIGICDFLMHSRICPTGDDTGELSYLAADTTPVKAKELMEMIWQEIPPQMQRKSIRWVSEKIPLKKWYLERIANFLNHHEINYGFGDHSASPEKILAAGYKLKFPETQQTIKDIMNWHKQEGFIAEKENKKKRIK